jgi:hypothetical protein
MDDVQPPMADGDGHRGGLSGYFMSPGDVKMTSHMPSHLSVHDTSST